MRYKRLVQEGPIDRNHSVLILSSITSMWMFKKYLYKIQCAYGNVQTKKRQDIYIDTNENDNTVSIILDSPLASSQQVAQIHPRYYRLCLA